MMKLPARTASICVAFTRLERLSGWSGQLLIEAIFLSNAFVAWLSLPIHEKASHLLSALHQLRTSLPFHFPVLHACGPGLMIAALSAALTPAIFNLAGMAPYQNGSGFLVAGWAMWCAARLLHGTHH